MEVVTGVMIVFGQNNSTATSSKILMARQTLKKGSTNTLYPRVAGIAARIGFRHLVGLSVLWYTRECLAQTLQMVSHWVVDGRGENGCTLTVVCTGLGGVVLAMLC